MGMFYILIYGRAYLFLRWPPPFSPQSPVVATPPPPPPLSVQTHHKFRKIRCFLLQKVRTSASEEPLPLSCPKNVRTGQTPLTADVFYGRPRMTPDYTEFIDSFSCLTPVANRVECK